MTTEEKIQKIVAAVNAGVPKIRLDRETHGASVRRLIRGKRVTVRKINEIYENLVSEQQNPQNSQEELDEYRNYCPDVPKETKIKEIIKAVNRDSVPKIKLDRSGAGNAVRNLISGKKSVGIRKINLMYARLQTIFSEENKSKSKSKSKSKKKTTNTDKKTEKKKVAKTKDNLKSKVLEQEKQISYLLNRMSFLEDKITELEKCLTIQNSSPTKVNGITITQKVDIVKGNKYKRWYGIYRENNKQRWIYIGKDKSKAKEKIDAWLSKNGKGDQR